VNQRQEISLTKIEPNDDGKNGVEDLIEPSDLP
jgi:hypothetical protein